MHALTSVLSGANTWPVHVTWGYNRSMAAGMIISVPLRLPLSDLRSSLRRLALLGHAKPRTQAGLG